MDLYLCRLMYTECVTFKSESRMHLKRKHFVTAIISLENVDFGVMEKASNNFSVIIVITII